ncbi:GlsB/YeaQ/YmgE family stress response membrane protein [Myxococcus hansupus]|uniref:GlsB/YeaQ/YmgE family stress response membrane protein n=1 Tax=Pseudomyxococcus hansupus TaxID=1297742 RepID=UPI001D04EA07|nr:GlsB/YeaQ/YmgE family stress response membrane protein [Myxococcus hansupus]
MKPSRALSTGLALLLFWSQGVAWAQTPTPSEPAQAPATELTPPPLVPAPGGLDAPTRHGIAEDSATPREDTEGANAPHEQAPAAQVYTRPADPVPRITVEFASGVAGGLAAGTAGLVLGFLLGSATVGCDECAIVAAVGGSSGVLLGIPAGTYLGGRMMGGKGSFLGTLGGSLVGWGAFALGTAVVGDRDINPGIAVVMLMLPIAGAVTGYELSSQRNILKESQREASSQVRLVPVAGMTSHGARLGLMGSF